MPSSTPRRSLTFRQIALRRWPSAKCVKHFDCNLFCIYTGPKGRGVSVPRSHWRSKRGLAWAEAADVARGKARV